ncbi:MAG: tRNA preQ1(34) S-adenosylmethionine ribosyltransferase-isomerase QueA [Tepidisphaeraceae bacterium]
MHTSDLDFHLPPELIAQDPLPKRSASRLLHYRRSDKKIAHQTFSDLPALLRRGDLLVFNDARVIPARFMLRKETGGLIEALFLGQPEQRRWHVMLRNLGSSRGKPLHFVEADLVAHVVDVGEAGEYTLEVETDEPAIALLGRIGRMPLPPYIKREKGHDPRDDADREHYQTIYAAKPGAVAAPTAGLHFTPELMTELDAKGFERAFVTLHIGMGTFKPVTADDLADHVMHREAYSITSDAADALNRAKRERRRIIAVGTTAARVLESQPSDTDFIAKSGETDIFIYPPYAWNHVGAMVTNFHLPKSTLIALVSAMVGLDEQRRIYAEAIANRYRFFSYGDASFIE